MSTVPPVSDDRPSAPSDTNPMPGSMRPIRDLLSPGTGRSRPPYHTRGLLPALILIAIGIVFLVGNIFPFGGGTLFIGLGLAFLVARLATGHYGYAVPAGILLGFGSFVALQDVSRFQPGWLPYQEGGWFMILLGLGFLAVYVIGLRPSAIWPFFPAAALIVVGLGTLNLVDFQPLAQLAWLTSYWPAILVLIGLWLLLRDRIPIGARRGLATLGVVLTITYGVIAIAATITAANPGSSFGRVGVVLPDVGAPLSDRLEQTVPIGAGDSFRVINPSGQTIVQGGGGSDVHVTATEHFWSREQQPQFGLTTTGNVVTLRTSDWGETWWGVSPRIDYVVQVPAGVNVDGQSSSGDIEISNISGAVQAENSSGSVNLAAVSAAVNVHSSSGALHLSDITGPLTASSTSGTVQATGVTRVRSVITTSGDVTLSGAFTEGSRVQSTGGGVTIHFAPSSAVQLAVATTSGGISMRDLSLTNQRQQSHSLSGALGAATGTLAIQTTSGDVVLDVLR